MANRVCILSSKTFYSNTFRSNILSKLLLRPQAVQRRTFHATSSHFSDDEKTTTTTTDKPNSKLKQTGQLAKVFAEYGSTAVIFHTTISLTSLGICYTAVSSGIDVVGLLQKYNLIKEITTEANIAGGATTFVISYAVHKVFMPIRIFCTVTCTPLLVKKLRQLGLLKKPAKQEQ